MTKFVYPAFILSLFSTNAFAQSAPGAGGFDFMQFLPLVAIFGIFYFLLIRPQQKKMKKHREMLDNVRIGDRVITAGGIIGSVEKVTSNEELEIKIAKDLTVRVVRSTVSQVVDKTAPVSIDQPSTKNAAKKAPARKAPAKKATPANKTASRTKK